MEMWYFEDIPLRQPLTTSDYVVTKRELLAFARKWDSLAIHTDPEAAIASEHGGLIASSIYTMAISSSLGKPITSKMAMFGGSEWKARFPNPVRPGDRLVQTVECIEKRVSRTKPDRGMIRLVTTMRNQKGETVLELECPLFVLRRNPG